MRILKNIAAAAVFRSSVSATALLFAIGNAYAQQVELAANDQGLTDIVVVGEKRETTMQRAPLAITAVAGERLQQTNINELNDMNGLVPGLTIAKNEGAERIITIRGIGYETPQNPNAQPGVAFHIDGVYIAHVMALSQDLIDVERVEVLRGPQGTVFGETSTGGAINVVSRKPVLGETSVKGDVSYGNHDFFKAGVSVNLPVGDTIAGRATVQYRRHDGYGYSVGVPGIARYDLDDADDFGARGSLLWQPNDRFTALLAGQLFEAHHNAFLQKNLDDTTPGARVVNQDYPGTFDLKTRLVYLTLSQELGDVAVLKSVSAYQYLDKHQTGDNDRSANPFYYDHLIFWQDKSKTFTEEVSLNSTSGGMIDWTLGAFYLRQRAHQNILEITSTPAVVVNGVPLKYQVEGPFQHTSWAGYGQATYRPSDALSLTAGARYSWDKITAQPVRFYDVFGVIAPRKATSAALTGKIGADYRLTENNMLYVTASRGYKPTGLNFNDGAMLTPINYKKEIVNALEIGTKNDFADRTIRLNASAYYYWYKNFQYTAEDPVPNAGGSANIPRAEIYGIEFEGSVAPIQGLRIDGTLSLGRGEFKGDYFTIDAQTAAQIRATTFANLGFPPAYYFDPRIIAAVAGGLENTKGNRVPKLPGVQGNLAVSYQTGLGDGELTMRGDMMYRGSFIYRIFNNAALDKVPAYTVFNAFIGYKPENFPISFSISGTNIFDKEGINSRFSDPYGSGTTSVEYIPPRQVFATIGFEF